MVARSAPPADSRAAATAALAATPAVPAVAGAAGTVAGAAGAKAVLERVRDSVLAVLRRLSRLRISRARESLTAQGVPAGDVEKVLADEEQREETYQENAKERLLRSLRLALAAPDISARASAVQATIVREQQFARQRADAQASRLFSAAEREELRRTSPIGAFWELGDAVVHTPDCLAMAGRFWPWAVLDLVHPPTHGGCACHLRSLGEAVSRGLLVPGEIPSVHQARLDAAPVINYLRAREPDAVAEEELTLREGLAAAGGDANYLAAAPWRVDRLLEGIVDAVWDEHLHPRDAFGKFVQTLDALQPKGRGAEHTAALGKVKVTRDGEESFRVVSSGRIVKGFSTPEDAARNALDRSVRSTSGDSVGGREKHKDYDAYLVNRGLNPAAPVAGTGTEMSRAEVEAEVARLKGEAERLGGSSDAYERRAASSVRKRQANYEAKLPHTPERVAPPVHTASRRPVAHHSTAFKPHAIDEFRAVDEAGRLWRAYRDGSGDSWSVAYFSEDPEGGRWVEEKGVPFDGIEEVKNRSGNAALEKIDYSVGATTLLGSGVHLAPGDQVEIQPDQWATISIIDRDTETVTFDDSGFPVGLKGHLGKRVRFGEAQGIPLAALAPAPAPGSPPLMHEIADRKREILERAQLEFLDSPDARDAAARYAGRRIGGQITPKEMADWGGRARYVEGLGTALPRGEMYQRGDPEVERVLRELDVVIAKQEKAQDRTREVIREANAGGGWDAKARVAVRRAQLEQRKLSRERARITKQDLPAVRRRAVKAVLERVRPGYGDGRLKERRTSSKLAKMGRDQMDLFPREWVDGKEEPVYRATTGRASYNEFDNRIRSKENDPSTMVHEYGHFMEKNVPGLREAERAFFASRIPDDAEGPHPLQKLQPGHGYRRDEKAFPDGFDNPYTGKDYGSGVPSVQRRNYEVFTMGLQSLFYPKGTEKDRNLKDWTLGVLLSL